MNNIDRFWPTPRHYAVFRVLGSIPILIAVLGGLLQNRGAAEPPARRWG